MKTQAIIVAAGEGRRLGAREAKALVLLKGQPILNYSLQSFAQSSLIESVIVVTAKTMMTKVRELIERISIQKIKKIVAGGPTRRASVSCGLKALDEDTDIVAIHDAARPLVAKQTIEEGIRLCYDERAVVAAVPVKSTIKKIHPQDAFVEATLNREPLWEAQTPQVFKRQVIVKAHREIADNQVTDDASLVERLGIPVKVFMGDYRNIKITTPEDLMVAEAFLREREASLGPTTSILSSHGYPIIQLCSKLA